jgi:hypothetical protein
MELGGFGTWQAILPLFLGFFDGIYFRLLKFSGGWVRGGILETFDRAIFGFLGHAVSGHTLKHLAAAYAGYWILVMLQRRRPVLSDLWF